MTLHYIALHFGIIVVYVRLLRYLRVFKQKHMDNRDQ